MLFNTRVYFNSNILILLNLILIIGRPFGAQNRVRMKLNVQATAQKWRAFDRFSSPYT